MDSVTELAARASSYLTILQDALALQPKHPAWMRGLPFSPLLLGPGPTQASATPSAVCGRVQQLCATVFAVPTLRQKALALVDSATEPESPPTPARTDYDKYVAFEAQAWALLGFVRQNLTGPLVQQALTASQLAPLPAGPRPFGTKRVWRNLRNAPSGQFSLPASQVLPHLPPEGWRRRLQAILYQDCQLRVALAKALEYLPMLAYALRQANHDKTKPPVSWRQALDYLLLNDKALEKALRVAKLALPFELVFRRELREINKRRRAVRTPAPPKLPKLIDPQREADNMRLCGLALSGGGIRSATFNLGIVQGLASAGLLPQLDYLSTVSGGSYLGAWLTAWIKREGVLSKVADRLCPNASPMPHAEEVRPIRWLRMYSNYLAPKASILSTDSWTVGITWLRNTLLNQFIIVLSLGALLALGAVGLYSWPLLSWSDTRLSEANLWRVAWVSLAVLAPVAILVSLGMRLFRHDAPWKSSTWMQVIVALILALALVGAYFTSGFFYQGHYPGFADGFRLLLPAAGVATLALILVAIVGGYNRCFYFIYDDAHLSKARSSIAWVVIALISALAAGIGAVALTGSWKLLSLLHPLPASPPLADSIVLFVLGQRFEHFPLGTPFGGQSFEPVSPTPALPLFYRAFSIGPPLVLEAVVLTVVTRMALLGRNFPDERREWWGRMGAVLHLAVVVWLALTGSTLLAREISHWLKTALAVQIAATAGGWLAVVGAAVRLAFSARTPAAPVQPGTSTWLDYLLRVAPYIFGLGLLLLTSSGLYWLLHQAPDYLKANAPALSATSFMSWLLADSAAGLLHRAWVLLVVLLLVALALGERVGVNEFSLHHFYRNRLVRAYLGASRPRLEREKTANPFTSFDRRDDLKLCSLRRNDPLQKGAGHPYDGPYLIINATLNATKVSDLAQQDRQAESFVFTPYYCGFDFARIRPVDPKRPNYEFGYRPTESYAYSKDHGPAVGTAMAISGAAANPNEGYHSSPTTAFLLTLFNVRLGWWMGNPRSNRAWQHADPHFGLLYLFKDMLGRSDTSDWFVNLSDGGHFDNMGLYELVRRRCRFIILGDGEEDHWFTCDGLANAIRRCRVDFGVEIALDVTPITNRKAGYSSSHHAIGTIQYPGDAPGQPSGYLLYLKASLMGDEPTDVREYTQYNRAFPHQSTGDQFFTEAQFESYHQLGLHIFKSVMKLSQPSKQAPASMADFFKQLLGKQKNRASTRPA